MKPASAAPQLRTHAIVGHSSVPTTLLWDLRKSPSAILPAGAREIGRSCPTCNPSTQSLAERNRELELENQSLRKRIALFHSLFTSEERLLAFVRSPQCKELLSMR